MTAGEPRVLVDDAAESPPLLVSSFVIEALAAMRDIAPEVPRGLLLKLLSRGWAGLAARLECATVNLDHRRLRPGLVAAIRAAGFTVLAYTVNDPARAKLLFDWGVTSVFSDVPDIILAMITGQEPVRSVIPDGPAIAPALGAVQ